MVRFSVDIEELKSLGKKGVGSTSQWSTRHGPLRSRGSPLHRTRGADFRWSLTETELGLSGYFQQEDKRHWFILGQNPDSSWSNSSVEVMFWVFMQEGTFCNVTCLGDGGTLFSDRGQRTHSRDVQAFVPFRKSCSHRKKVQSVLPKRRNRHIRNWHPAGKGISSQGKLLHRVLSPAGSHNLFLWATKIHPQG